MKNDIKTIREEFRSSDEARYIHRLHGVLLVLLGLSTVKAGQLLGDPQRTVAYWVMRFKTNGLAGLRDAEKPGRPETLKPAQKKALWSALNKSPRSAGFQNDVWTGILVSSLLKKRFGLSLTVRQCARILKAHKDEVRL